jgi:hypothetical protein
MNGAKKFHSADGPAFNQGEVWISGEHEAQIIRTERYGCGKWDVDVYYSYPNDPLKEVRKNAWSFQVRYQHKADLEI